MTIFRWKRIGIIRTICVQRVTHCTYKYIGGHVIIRARHPDTGVYYYYYYWIQKKKKKRLNPLDTYACSVYARLQYRAHCSRSIKKKIYTHTIHNIIFYYLHAYPILIVRVKYKLLLFVLLLCVHNTPSLRYILASAYYSPRRRRRRFDSIWIRCRDMYRIGVKLILWPRTYYYTRTSRVCTEKIILTGTRRWILQSYILYWTMIK